MKKTLVVLMWCLGIIAAFHFTNRYTQIEENLMAIAKSTLDFITKEEGSRNKAYQDSKGLWTIGVGHLIKTDEEYLLTATLTDEQVEELLRKDLKWCSEAVETSVKVPLQQHQFDALYSLCFNIGADHFKQSEVVQHINQLDYAKAADAFLNWSKPPVLRPRREKERTLFLTAI